MFKHMCLVPLPTRLSLQYLLDITAERSFILLLSAFAPMWSDIVRRAHRRNFQAGRADRSDCTSSRPMQEQGYLMLRRCIRLSGLSNSFRATPNPSLLVHRPFTHRHFATWKMSQPTYLTGDKAGIEAFVDKFDVCSSLRSVGFCVSRMLMCET